MKLKLKETRICSTCGESFTAYRRRTDTTCPRCVWAAPHIAPRNVSVSELELDQQVRVTMLSVPHRWSEDNEANKPYTAGAVHIGTVDDIHPIGTAGERGVDILLSNGDAIEITTDQQLLIEVLA